MRIRVVLKKRWLSGWSGSDNAISEQRARMVCVAE